MNSLLKIDKSSNALGQLHNQNKIFVIGESHCLSAHGSKVAYLNETFSVNLNGYLAQNNGTSLNLKTMASKKH